ncbi:MAG: hypothetical protein AAGE01_20425, partial [Pseudomonadota bacterium]
MNSFLLQLVLTHLLVGCALTGLVAVTLRFLPSLNAATRHAVWAGVLLLLVAMPLLALLPDAPSLPREPAALSAPIDRAATTPPASAPPAGTATTPDPIEPDSGALAGAVVASVWLAGVL